MRVCFFVFMSLGLLSIAGVQADPGGGTLVEGPMYGWVTDKEYEHLHGHPRLFVSQAQLQRVVEGRTEPFADLYANVAEAATRALEDQDDPLAGMAVWPRAIRMQDRALALILQWHLTGNRQYLDALLADIEKIRTWANPRHIGLPEGQFATVIAMAYDLLYDDLSAEQRERLIQIARNDFLLPFLSRTAPRDREERLPDERRSWWQAGPGLSTR